MAVLPAAAAAAYQSISNIGSAAGTATGAGATNIGGAGSFTDFLSGAIKDVAADPSCAVVAAASGVALLAASALTRFGVFEAGLSSARDPRYTIEPQKNRLAARRAAGITGDSITTAG